MLNYSHSSSKTYSNIDIKYYKNIFNLKEKHIQYFIFYV